LTRKIVLSAQVAKVSYVIMIGGCGSLYVPNLGSGHTTAVDYPEFWRAFSNLMADSEAMTHYMEDVLGHMGTELRKLRNARIARREGRATKEDLETISAYEKMTMEGDEGLTYVRACRASFMFFDGNRAFKWSYASPPPGYRPGRRTGEYRVSYDVLPLDPVDADPTDLDDKMLGITTGDMAVAIADEAEKRGNTWKHWTAVGSVDPDTPVPTYARLG
jgi:putative NADH-flavin reductase